jgi:predicted ATPase
MIKSWKLTCFKSILEEDLDLAPLTVFAGPNSSGKSSFFQSILLLAQTMRSYNRNTLVLKGEYADLGQYKDIVCDKSPGEDGRMSIRFSLAAAKSVSFSPVLRGKDGSGELVFRFAGYRYLAGKPQSYGTEKAALLSTHFEWAAPGAPKPGENYSFDFIRGENSGPDGDQVSSAEGRIPGKSTWKDSSILDTSSVEIVNDFSGKIEKAEFDEKNICAAYFKHFLPEKIEYDDPAGSGFQNRSLPLNIREGIEDFQKYFTGYIKYLGPLRASPRKCYPINDADTDNIGVKGENMPSVLYENRDTPVNFLSSSYFETQGKDSIESDKASIHIDSTTLEKAVNQWVKYIGVSGSVKVKKSEDDYIPTADGKYFTHVGVGVSQVVPIVVMCLLAPEDSTVIIEQPELHLHPKMQSRLADFFIAASLSGRQCLIETHSEHIVNQLCYRYASTVNDDILKDKSKIYFVEKHEGTSSFRSIDIDRYGALSDWPEDFFDESQLSTDKIIDAVTKKIEAEENND